MSQPLQYAFLDESGTVSPFAGSHFLVVSLISIAYPRALDLHVRRTQKKYGASLRSGEMKADGSRETVIAEILAGIVQEPVAIVAIVEEVIEQAFVITCQPVRQHENSNKSSMTYMMKTLFPTNSKRFMTSCCHSQPFGASWPPCWHRQGHHVRAARQRDPVA